MNQIDLLVLVLFLSGCAIAILAYALSVKPKAIIINPPEKYILGITYSDGIETKYFQEDLAIGESMKLESRWKVIDVCVMLKENGRREL